MPLVEFPNGERRQFPDDMPEEQMHSAAASYWSSVEFPNGEHVKFPDDMPEKEMQSAAASYWSGKQKGPMSTIESFGYGAGNIAYGLSKMAARALPQEARGIMARPLGKLEENIRQRKIEYEARKPEGFDVAKMAGEIAATLPIALAGGGGLAGGMVAGAIAGAASPETDDEDHYWQSKLKQAGIGAAGSIVGQVAGKIISGAVNPAARELVSEGVTPTLGQAIGPKAAVAEEKLTSIPFLGSAIVRGRAKASGQVGPGGVKEVFNNLSGAFDEIAPKLQMDTRQLVGDLTPIVERVHADLPSAEATRFGQILDQALSKKNFKDAEEYLTDFSTRYKGPNADPDSILLAESLDDVLSAAREGLAKQNPAYASRLRAINEGWSNYSVIRDAAFAAEKRGRDAFSPEEFSQAVAAHSRRLGKAGIGRFAQGQAQLQDLSSPMMRVLGKKYPDSGTPGRMMQASNVASLLGPLLGHPATLALPAAEALASVPYMSPLLRKATASAILRRPAAAEPIGLAAKIAGRVASPGVGLVLSEAGAP